MRAPRISGCLLPLLNDGLVFQVPQLAFDHIAEFAGFLSVDLQMGRSILPVDLQQPDDNHGGHTKEHQQRADL